MIDIPAAFAGLEKPSFDAIRLAVILSPAIRIEPELIRAARLEILPTIDVGAEVDLWFSDWVGTRSTESIMFMPELLPTLRRALGDLLKDSPAEHPVHRTWEVISRVHASTSPALRVEEYVTWLALEGAPGDGSIPDATRDKIDSAFRPVLHALVDEGRDGVADWFAGALQRLPAEVRSTITAWQISQVVGDRFPDAVPSGWSNMPSGLVAQDVAVIAGAVGRVNINVVSQGNNIILSEIGQARSVVQVPATVPRIFELVRISETGRPTETIFLEPEGEVTVAVGGGAVRLRAADGTVYEVKPTRNRLGWFEAIQSLWLTRTPTGRRLRAQLSRLVSPWQSARLSEVLEPLIASHRDNHPKADAWMLQRAFDTAARWHSGQYRKSGDPYITHPLAVATILGNLGMDTTTLVAALLHDTVEATKYTLDQVRVDFGGEVALLVDGVTRLDKVKLGDAAKAETIRKMVVAMAKDPRVLVASLACRLHDMRTLTFLPRSEQLEKAKETLEILAPLAHRLGMNTIKWELEDLSFGTLFPKRYEEINRLIGEHQPQREALLRQVTQKVQTELKAAKIKAETTGRPKHLYSIYQKMIVRGRDFNDIYDLVGVRILVDTVKDCYAALGVIHANWQLVPGRFKDYIAMPKFNMYQSLHTTVIGPTAKPVEVQIRTYAMHRTAEFGIAAHWKYKEHKGTQIVGPPAHIDEMTWLRQLLDWQREAADPSEFLDALRFDLSSQEVYVFTPKGDVIPLPTGSTPVDFAYAVHTEVGHKCIGARVNGKLVPLERVLSNGDVIEIFTSRSKTAGPTQDWLGFVKSPRAHTKIRQYFNKERREEAIEAGKDAIVKAMREQGMPLQRMLTSDALMSIARDLHLADVASVYAAVGDSQVSAQSVVQKLMAAYGGEEGVVDEIAESFVVSNPQVEVSDMKDPSGFAFPDGTIREASIADCCSPDEGERIYGLVEAADGLVVHRSDCSEVTTRPQFGNIVVGVGSEEQEGRSAQVDVQVEALDHQNLLSEITRVLSQERVKIVSVTANTSRDRVSLSRFRVEIGGNDKHLSHVMEMVRRIDGVFDVYTVTSQDD